MADREPKTGADADRLGREEWIKDSTKILGRNADAGIPNLYGDARGRGRARRDTNLVLVRLALGQGLRCVHDEIQENLAQARLVCRDVVRLVEVPDHSCAV